MSALLLALWLQATPSPPARPTPPAPAASVAAEAQAAAPAQAAEHAGAPAGTETEPGPHAAAHEAPDQVLAHHVLDQPVFGFWSKHLLYFMVAAALVILMARAAVRSYRGGTVPHGVGTAVEGLVHFIRDDIAEANIGHDDGRRFTPLLCSFFFFILTAALLGLVPLPGYSGGRWGLASTTSTANITVTMALALISFVAQQYAGIRRYGVIRHFRNLVPPGLPLLLLPIMIPVEIVSMFTKPFALMIRLFANMLAGHMVVTTLILLIPVLTKISLTAGLAITPLSIGLSLFVLLLEVLVAFIQAYIFTMLSAVFIGMYAHPSH